MSETIRERTPRSRGRVHCDACGRRIPKGEQYLRATNVEYGDLWEWRECQPCQAAVSHVLEWLGPYSDGDYNADTFQGWAWEALAYSPASDYLFLYETTGMWVHYLEDLATSEADNAVADADPAQAWDDDAWAAFTWRMQTSPVFNRRRNDD